MRTLRPPELEAEQEVDVRRYASVVAAHWWLPLAGVLAGVLLGYLLSLGGGSFYRAEATVYLGQPFTPGGGGQIQSLATNPSTANEIVRSAAAQRKAARAAGLRPAQLRGRVTSREVAPRAGVRRVAGQTPLVEIAVEGAARLKVERAANALAREVVAGVSPYVSQKQRQLQQRAAFNRAELRRINNEVEGAQRLLVEVRGNRVLGDIERLILITNQTAILTSLEQRRATVQANIFDASGLLSLARNVEQSRVVQPAVAVKTAARSTGTSLIVGAAIGLVLGILAAVVWEPFTATRRRISL